MATNRKVVLTAPVRGIPQAEDFRVVEASLPVPKAGEILVRHIYLSLDPYQRAAMSGAHPTAASALQENETPSAETIGQIITSRHRDFAEGDYVRHAGGWQEYSTVNADQAVKVDPALAPLSTYLGILGMPGLTAWASMVKLADVQPQQSILVSAASGPVGSMVGQIAIQLGAEAYGIAGSDEKCSFVVNELGFNGCVNYKMPNYPDSMAKLMPDGIDIYHDNVGGQMLSDAFSVLKNYGTVILCGLISQYNTAQKGKGFNLALPILKRAVMKGLVVYDYEDRRTEFFDQVAPWVRDGKIKYREDRVNGIEHTGAHFSKLMNGDNFGKALVVTGPETL
jgi:NADPH-dependent curcumin reductase CurA